MSEIEDMCMRQAGGLEGKPVLHNEEYDHDDLHIGREEKMERKGSKRRARCS